MRILLTGSASHLAQALLPQLLKHPDVSRIIGIDIKSSAIKHPKFEQYHLDIRDPKLAYHMLKADAVIHLAFVVLRSTLGRERKNRELARAININGSLHVFDCAEKASIPIVIHMSSSAVYGAWPDNPDLMNESQPLRAMPGFSYAEDKVTLEHDISQRIQAKTNTRWVSLRPHVILGQHAQIFLKKLLRQPFYPYFPEPQPMSQCIWEDDVAKAVLQALFRPVEGAFNLAAEPALPFREMIKIGHTKTYPLPFNVLKTFHKGLWLITGAAEEPGWLSGMKHSLAVDCSRAKQELHWQPSLSSHDCILRTVGDVIE